MAAKRMRIKGQEVELRIIKDSVLQSALTKISNFTIEAKFEVTEEGFLGGLTNEHDDIYNGCKVDFEMQLDGPEWLDLQQTMINRAKRITPDVEFSVAATLMWPGGETRGVVIPDLKFEAQPLSVGSRKDFVKVKIAGSADDFDLQTM